MNAYYYSFRETGILEIDRILSAVAHAGKAYHHTECWGDPCEWAAGKSCAGMIQEAADHAAESWKQKAKECDQ